MRTLILLGLTALTASSALAHPDEAEATAMSEVPPLLADGWTLRSVWRATLSTGRTSNFTVTLHADNDHRMEVCGDSTVHGVDLLLYDNDGMELERTHASGGCTQLTHRPDETGLFHVVLYQRGVDQYGDGALALTWLVRPTS